MLISNKIVKIGLLACFSGFTKSAFELFLSLNQTFPDIHGPIMGMIYVHVAQSEIDEGDELLEKNKKIFLDNDAEDDFKIMQVMIEMMKPNHGRSVSLLRELKSASKQSSRDFADAMHKKIG